jgi:hypothetical protein
MDGTQPEIGAYIYSNGAESAESDNYPLDPSKKEPEI